MQAYINFVSCMEIQIVTALAILTEQILLKTFLHSTVYY